MFNNISGLIKLTAKLLTIIGIACSCVIGIYMMVLPNGLMYGLLVMVAGSVFSWIGSFLLYGFGEIIDLLTEIKKSLNKSDVIVKENDKNN